MSDSSLRTLTRPAGAPYSGRAWVRGAIGACAFVLLAAVALAQSRPALAHRDITVVEVSGTPRERGVAHGRALKAQIHEVVGDFRKDIERDHSMAADAFIARFMAATDFMPAIERWTPGLLDEVRGIAEGASARFEDIYVFQMAGDIWSMGNRTTLEKCTAIAVDRRGDQPTMVAQNLDIPGFYQKCPTLLRVRRKGGPDTLALTCPGLIGVSGMNSAAVAVCCNTVLQLRPDPRGVPCLFVVRGILEQHDLASAEAWLRKIPHAVGQNYTIGDPTGARAFECSAGGAVRFVPEPGADFTYHTNHPVVSRDWHPDYLKGCESRGVEPADGLPTCGRMEPLKQRIRSSGPITRDSIKSALASRDDPAHPIAGDFTYACTVFILRGKPELEMAPGRPDRFAFQTFTF